MITRNTPVTFNGKTLNLHIVQGIPQLQGDFAINTDKKTIKGTILSFADDTITNNFSNGTVRAAKMSTFVVENADLTDIAKAVATYVDGEGVLASLISKPMQPGA